MCVCGCESNLRYYSSCPRSPPSLPPPQAPLLQGLSDVLFSRCSHEQSANCHALTHSLAHTKHHPAERATQRVTTVSLPTLLVAISQASAPYETTFVPNHRAHHSNPTTSRSRPSLRKKDVLFRSEPAAGIFPTDGRAHWRGGSEAAGTSSCPAARAFVSSRSAARVVVFVMHLGRVAKYRM